MCQSLCNIFDPIKVFLLRDILTSNTTHEEMVETLEVAHRSKNLILGLDSFKNMISKFRKYKHLNMLNKLMK